MVSYYTIDNATFDHILWNIYFSPIDEAADDFVGPIKLGDRSIFADSTITMMFDPKSYDLRQWTITDNQGKDTSVMIFNTQTGVTFDKAVFRIPYDEVHNKNGANGR